MNSVKVILDWDSGCEESRTQTQSFMTPLISTRLSSPTVKVPGRLLRDLRLNIGEAPPWVSESHQKFKGDTRIPSHVYT